MPRSSPNSGCGIDDWATTSSQRASRPARLARHQRHRRRPARRRRQVTSSSTSYHDDDLLLVSSPTCHELGIPAAFGGNDVQAQVANHRGRGLVTTSKASDEHAARMHKSKRPLSVVVSSDAKSSTSSTISVRVATRSYEFNQPEDLKFISRSSWTGSCRHGNITSGQPCGRLPCGRQATADDSADELLTSSTTTPTTVVIATAFVRRRNERERERVRCVNEAYEALRQRIPEEFEAIRVGTSGLPATRTSKVETLRSAIRYIRFLIDVLHKCSA